MNRREFVALLSSTVAAQSATTALASPPQNKAADINVNPHRNKRPNVVVMICDDLGYGDLGCYGSSLPTPNLDRMAAEGIRFTRFNAAHPICSASRASLLTGRYGLRSNTAGAFGPHTATGTSLDETLLSNLFHAQGYKTKAIGKWHLGDGPDYLPTNRGFDSYYGVPYSIDMSPLPLIRDTTILEEHTKAEQLTPRYTEEAVEYIDQSDSTPFFMYVAYSFPHDPAQGSERFRGKSGFGDVGDAIAEIDWSAGEIIRAVERKGIASDTLICFTSDHGPWYQGNPGFLRGRKASTFEGGFRVPFLALWKGTIAPGQVVDAWSSNLDIVPTLSTLCNLNLPPKPLDGVDMSKVLCEGAKTSEPKSRIYFSPMSGNGQDVHCIRKQHWKLRVAQCIKGEIYLNDRTTQAKESAWLAVPELYDLSGDPTESYDIAHLHPKIVDELSKELEELLPTFPERVIAANDELKKKKGDISTPSGASPRPVSTRG
jgi:arylsulfatase A